MKVTMVGTKGSGKTVFSAALYWRLIRRRCLGLSLYPAGPGLPAQLREVFSFRSSLESIADNQWPETTKETTRYPLDLLFQGRRFANFDWLDYRGGFIDDPSIDPTKAEEVQRSIAESNAVILFVDAKKMTEITDEDQAGFQIGADALIQVISGVAVNYPQSRLAILIVLSKCDAVGANWSNNDYQQLIERALRIFEPLREIIAAKNESTGAIPFWNGGVLPLSAIGLGNVTYGADNTPTIAGFIDPYQVEHAMIYCIDEVLRQENERVTLRRNLFTLAGFPDLCTNLMNGTVDELQDQNMGRGSLERYQTRLVELIGQIGPVAAIVRPRITAL